MTRPLTVQFAQLAWFSRAKSPPLRSLCPSWLCRIHSPKVVVQLVPRVVELARLKLSENVVPEGVPASVGGGGVPASGGGGGVLPAMNVLKLSNGTPA